MGMFDTVYWKCPTCREPLYQQSKAGECGLAEYKAKNVPRAIGNELSCLVYQCHCKAFHRFESEPREKHGTRLTPTPMTREEWDETSLDYRYIWETWCFMWEGHMDTEACRKWRSEHGIPLTTQKEKG